MPRRLNSAPSIPENCLKCSVRPLNCCRAFDGQRLQIVEDFKIGDRILAAGETVYRQSEPCRELYNVLDGWVILYRLLPSGRRQILEFALPGAFLGYHPDLRTPLSHGAECLTDVALCIFPRRSFADLVRQHGHLAEALATVNARQTAAAYDHLTNVASRQASARVAHLMLELAFRMQRTTEGASSVELPLTQTHIGEALGLTSVYVSQTLSRLQDLGLLVYKSNRLWIPDVNRLAEYAEFDSLIVV